MKRARASSLSPNQTLQLSALCAFLAPAEVRRRFLAADPGMTADELERCMYSVDRLAAQLPIGDGSTVDDKIKFCSQLSVDSWRSARQMSFEQNSSTTKKKYQNKKTSSSEGASTPAETFLSEEAERKAKRDARNAARRAAAADKKRAADAAELDALMDAPSDDDAKSSSSSDTSSSGSDTSDDDDSSLSETSDSDA